MNWSDQGGKLIEIVILVDEGDCVEFADVLLMYTTLEVWNCLCGAVLSL